jgi:hypothetical protein
MSADGQQKQPRQSQSHQPGRESEMIPKPEFQPRFRGADKLKGKVARGDSGYRARCRGAYGAQRGDRGRLSRGS